MPRQTHVDSICGSRSLTIRSRRWRHCHWKGDSLRPMFALGDASVTDSFPSNSIFICAVNFIGYIFLLPLFHLLWWESRGESGSTQSRYPKSVSRIFWGFAISLLRYIYLSGPIVRNAAVPSLHNRKRLVSPITPVGPFIRNGARSACPQNLRPILCSTFSSKQSPFHFNANQELSIFFFIHFFSLMVK